MAATPAFPPEYWFDLAHGLGGSAEFHELNQALRNAPDSKAALMAVARLDATLGHVIRAHFENDLLDGDGSTLFGDAGALARLDAKVSLAYGLGVFGRLTREDLLLISRIQHCFGAADANTSFEVDDVRELCGKLSAYRAYIAASMVQPCDGFDVLPPRDRFLATIQCVNHFLEGLLRKRTAAKLQHLQRSLRDLHKAQRDIQSGRLPGVVRSRAVGTGLP